MFGSQLLAAQLHSAEQPLPMMVSQEMLAQIAREQAYPLTGVSWICCDRVDFPVLIANASPSLLLTVLVWVMGSQVRTKVPLVSFKAASWQISS